MQKQFMGVAALGAALAVADAGHAQAVQWRTQDGGNGHWYRLVVSGPISWPNARAACEQVGGHLVTPTGPAEAAFLLSIANRASNPTAWVTDFGGNAGGPWLGGYQPPDASPVQPWAWVTGEPWNWTGWAPGEPNGGFGPGLAVTNMLGYSNSNSYRGWGDVWLTDIPPYSPSPSYVVEWSADCNNDGIVDYGQCRDGSLPDYNGNNIPDCCETSTSCNAGAYPVRWRVEDGGNGHWYALVTATDFDWHQADAAATAQGGHLATIASSAENHLVFMLGRSAWRDGWAGPWLGGYREQGGFRWVDGTNWDFTDWDCMNPSNSMGNEDRLHYGINPACRTWPNPSPTWNDAFSGSPMSGYMVEWSADCNDDGIVDYGQILLGQLADTNQNGVPDSCETPDCTTADLFRDFNVNGADLGILLAQWGPVTALTVSDLDRDGAVDGIDLGLLLSFWGPCPG